MSSTSKLPTPPKAGAKERYRSLEAALSEPAAKRCFVLPGAVFIASLILAYGFAPSFTHENASDFTSLFSTAAQLIVTLLVALALELRSIRNVNARWLIASGTLTYVAVGAVAGVIALNPHLGPCGYRVLFSLTMAAGLAALLSVLLIALEGVLADFPYRPGDHGDSTK